MTNKIKFTRRRDAHNFYKLIRGAHQAFWEIKVNDQSVGVIIKREPYRHDLSLEINGLLVEIRYNDDVVRNMAFRGSGHFGYELEQMKSFCRSIFKDEGSLEVFCYKYFELKHNLLWEDEDHFLFQEGMEIRFKQKEWNILEDDEDELEADYLQTINVFNSSFGVDQEIGHLTLYQYEGFCDYSFGFGLGGDMYYWLHRNTIGKFFGEDFLLKDYNEVKEFITSLLNDGERLKGFCRKYVEDEASYRIGRLYLRD